VRRVGGRGAPSEFERHVRRVGIGSQPGTTGSGVSRTPLQHLEGVITPNGHVHRPGIRHVSHQSSDGASTRFRPVGGQLGHASLAAGAARRPLAVAEGLL